jgi:hydroxymethylpyrimidine pyrophosphatase-like HAD family hydrolase
MGKTLLEGELVLAVDFDGTISTEPDMGHELVLQPECKRVLQRLHEDGIRLMLWTCRTGPYLQEALDFLESENLLYVFETINDQLPEVNEKYAPHVARKVGADFYIDDKNLAFEVDWLEIEHTLYGCVEGGKTSA